MAQYNSVIPVAMRTGIQLHLRRTQQEEEVADIEQPLKISMRGTGNGSRFAWRPG